MERLVDILPASIKGFTIISTMGDQDAVNLMKGMAEFKEEKLPKLTRITFECPDPLPKDMKKTLSTAGVELFSWKTPIRPYTD